MRIAIDARYMRSEFSGIGEYSENLVEALAREDRENEYVVFVHSSYHGNPEIGGNFTLVPERARPVSSRTVTTFGRAVRRQNADLLHSLFPLAPITWNGRLLATIHDLQPLIDPEFTGHRGPLKRFGYDLFYHFTYPAVLRKADFLISDSYATRQSILEMFPELTDKILVVYAGVGKDCFGIPSEEQMERVRDKYDLPRRFLFYLGSTRPNKNLLTMLEAFDLFVKRHPEQDDLHWVLVVKPDRFFDTVFARIRQKNLLRRVQIHEQVSEAERSVFYRLATVLYFVTKYEGFGLPVLEAQAQSLPVVASTHGALPEISGRDAVLCDPDDPENILSALEMVLSDEQLRARMIEGGLRNVTRFNWSRTAKEIVDMYNHLFA